MSDQKSSARRGEAIAAYKKAAKIKPDRAKAPVGLGTAYRQSGRTDDAIVCFKKAVALKAKARKL
jgi:Flp pilus assembly protein TadD